MSLTEALEAEAQAFAAEHGELPPAAAAPQSPPAPEVQAPLEVVQPTGDELEHSEEQEQPLTPQERTEEAAKLAALGVGVVDVLAVKFIGKRMKLEAHEEERLVKLATPVVEKYLPSTEGKLSPEELLLGGLLMVYGPKYFTPEPPAASATPAGGGAAAKDTSGTSPQSPQVLQ